MALMQENEEAVTDALEVPLDSDSGSGNARAFFTIKLLQYYLGVANNYWTLGQLFCLPTKYHFLLNIVPCKTLPPG